LTTTGRLRARGGTPASRIISLMLLAALVVAAGSVVAAGPVAADSRLVAVTVEHGIRLKLNLPARRWEPDARISGFVRVTNTNDRTAWFLDTDCRDVGVDVRIPTSPNEGRHWTGDRAAFKSLALSRRADIGPVVDHFKVEGANGDCAEPVAHALPAGGSRGYHVSIRVRHAGLGVTSLDVSASFQFEGFRKSDAQWQDLVPSPITASVHVPMELVQASILSPVKAIDLGLAKGWVREGIAASDRAGWIRADVELAYRGHGLWQWRVGLWGDVGDQQHQAMSLVSFVANARTGAVTAD